MFILEVETPTPAQIRAKMKEMKSRKRVNPNLGLHPSIHYPTMISTTRLIDIFREVEALGFLEGAPLPEGTKSHEVLAGKDPADWLLEYGLAFLTDSELASCAIEAPAAALHYASHALTPEQIDSCAHLEPKVALERTHRLLSPSRLDWCAAQFPRLALAVAHELSPERLDWCAQRFPSVALTLAGDVLTQERLEWCTEREPHGLRRASQDRLPEEFTLSFIIRRSQNFFEFFDLDFYDRDSRRKYLQVALEVDPELAIVYTHRWVFGEDLKALIRKNPEVSLKVIGDRLSSDFRKELERMVEDTPLG